MAQEHAELRTTTRNSSTDNARLETKNANLEGKTKINGRAEDYPPPKDTPNKKIEPNITKEEESSSSNRPEPERATTPP